MEATWAYAQKGSVMSNVIKTTGRFVRFFSTFEEGLEALRELSYSASQALGDATDEESAVSHLATNVAFDRPTGNGVGWAQCSVRIDAYGIEYCTRGDLRFGWKVSPEWRGGFDLSRVEKRFSFFITHPRGENIPLDSSLGVSAREHGWNEVFEDGYAREPRAYEPRPPCT